MTLRMADSAESQALAGLAVQAYASYVDGGIGDQPNAARVAVMFPGARHLSIALSAVHDADCLDVEPGAATPADVLPWAGRQGRRGVKRPVVYASVALMREEVWPQVAHAPGALRLWTAHYGQGEHICGPHTCGELPVDADGTQWTDAFHGPAGVVDMSLLADGFFGPLPWTFGPVRGLVGTYGPHSLRLTWSSPGQVAPEAVHHYQVTVRLKGKDIHGFPVNVPKGPDAQESVQWDGVERGSYDEAMVRAVAVDGHASPWATVGFRWPA